MKINGVGTVKKEVAMAILTKDGREAVKNGDITTEELGVMYKIELVKRASKVGDNPDTFNANFERIPETLVGKLTPEELAALVDAFFDCYGDGKRATE